MTHRKFPSIEQFNQIYTRETWDGVSHEARRTLTYRAKVKLHGSNMAICIDPDGRVTSQSRKQTLRVETDTSGFAQWLAPQSRLWSKTSFNEVVSYYGEWAGPGICKGDAVQLTDKKRFYIFAMSLGEAVHHRDDALMTPRIMITDPATIERHLPEGLDRDEVRVLPYEGEPFEFDFSDPNAIQATLNDLNTLVDRVAERDPYIHRTFEIDHPGEGYVLVPHADMASPLSCEDYSRMSFKAKTEKHRVRKQSKAATAREPLPQTAIQFIETFCTSARVDQAIDEVCGGPADVTRTRDVINWVLDDIHKEAADEFSAMDLPFARFKSEIATVTRAHFMTRIPFK